MCWCRAQGVQTNGAWIPKTRFTASTQVSGPRGAGFLGAWRIRVARTAHPCSRSQSATIPDGRGSQENNSVWWDIRFMNTQRESSRTAM